MNISLPQIKEQQRMPPEILRIKNLIEEKYLTPKNRITTRQAFLKHKNIQMALYSGRLSPNQKPKSIHDDNVIYSNLKKTFSQRFESKEQHPQEVKVHNYVQKPLIKPILPQVTKPELNTNHQLLKYSRRGSQYPSIPLRKSSKQEELDCTQLYYRTKYQKGGYLKYAPHTLVLNNKRDSDKNSMKIEPW